MDSQEEREIRNMSELFDTYKNMYFAELEKVKALEEENEILRIKIDELAQLLNKKNARNAGRKKQHIISIDEYNTMKKNGLKNPEMAKRLGVSVSTLQRCIRDFNKIKSDTK